MRRRWQVPVVLLGPVLAVLPASPASAHPLGNFSVNTATDVVVVAGGLEVTHVVDLAEIPTVQLAQPSAADADADGRLSAVELTTHADAECARAADRLVVEVDGSGVELTVEQTTGQLREGQAGLPTARIECRLAADRRPASSLAITDPTVGGQQGWREVTARSVCGRVTASDVAATSASRLLTDYPEDLLASPPDVRSARLSLEPGGPCRVSATGATGTTSPNTILPRGVDRFTSAYTGLVSRVELTAPVAALSIALSVVLGAGHALAPGHGKTVVAAYLVGQRGRRRHAVWLGATVTVTHTAGVLLLGLFLTLGRIGAPERVVPLTEVLSGLLLAAVGAYLLARAWRRRRAAGAAARHHDPAGHSLAHRHGQEDHPEGARHLLAAAAPPVPVGTGARSGSATATTGAAPATATATVRTHGVHAHGVHAHGVHTHGGKPHSHLPTDDRPLGWRSLALMGIAGGLVPSPSALVVLLGATGLGRPAFGVVLVVGYGVGMALTLTAAGLLLMRARSVVESRGWRSGRIARLQALLPVLTAGAVIAVGTVLVLRGLLPAGLL